MYIYLYERMGRILKESCENIPWGIWKKWRPYALSCTRITRNGEHPDIAPKVAFLWKSRVLHSVSWSLWYPEFEITCKSSRRRMHAYIKDVPVRMREHIYTTTCEGGLPRIWIFQFQRETLPALKPVRFRLP